MVNTGDKMKVQVNANIFKVMHDSLLRDFYLVSLFFVAL